MDRFDLEDWTIEDLQMVTLNHFELCDFLHQHVDELPPKIANAMHDLLYAYFEP